jgi:hypothetical protein
MTNRFAERRVGAVWILALAASCFLSAPLCAQQPAREKADKGGEHAREEKVKAEERIHEERKKELAEKARLEAERAEHERAVAEKMVHFTRIHRDREARLNRLIGIYKTSREEKKVAELEEMRAKELKRYDNAMDGFRKELGPVAWARLEKELKGPSARAIETRHEQAKENAERREERKAGEDAERGKEKREKDEKEHPSKEKPPGKPGGGR